MVELLTLYGLRIDISEKEYFLSKREGKGATYKPISFHRTKLSLLKKIAILIDADVEIKSKKAVL